MATMRRPWATMRRPWATRVATICGRVAPMARRRPHLSPAHAAEIAECAVEAEAGERDSGAGEEGEDGGAETVFGERVADVFFERRDGEDGTRGLDLVEPGADGLGERHGVAMGSHEEPRRGCRGAKAGIDGGRGRVVEAVFPRVRSDAADDRGRHHYVLDNGAQMAADGRDLTQIAVGKAAVDEHADLDREVVFHIVGIALCGFA
jgi:hypothetical protein